MKSTLLLILMTIGIHQYIMAGKYTDLVRSYYTSVDAGNFEAVAGYLSADFKAYLPFNAEPYNAESFRELLKVLKTGFPDMRHTVLETSESKGTCALKGTLDATNTGSLFGNPPTGNTVHIAYQAFFRFNNDRKISQVDVQYDVSAFNAQLMEGIPAMNKAGELVNTFFRLGGNGHDLNFLHDILATNFTSNSFPVQNATKAQFIDGMKAFLKAFPDITVMVNNQHFEGNKVFTYGYWTATHKGEFMGMAPTGKKLKVEFMDIWTEENGQLVRNEVVMDIAGLQQQLGDPMAAMKANNVTTVKSIFAAFEKGDIPSVLAKLSNNIVWTDAGTGVDRLYTGVRRGKEAVGEFFTALNELLITEKFMVNNYIADGNKVVANGFYGGKTKVNGRPVFTDFSMTFEFDDNGKVVKHHLYLDTDNISKALAGSTNNIALARMAYENFLAGDIDGILQGLSEDITWVHAGDPSKLPFAGTFKGKDQVMKFFQAIGNSVEVLKFEPYDFKQSGNAVTNKIRISGKVLKTGVVVNNMTSIKWTFDNQGKVVKWEASGDMRELEAALTKG